MLLAVNDGGQCKSFFLRDADTILTIIEFIVTAAVCDYADGDKETMPIDLCIQLLTVVNAGFSIL